MSKSNEELNKIKEEVESISEKLKELTPEELEQVAGGTKITTAWGKVCDYFPWPKPKDTKITTE